VVGGEERHFPREEGIRHAFEKGSEEYRLLMTGGSEGGRDIEKATFEN